MLEQLLNAVLFGLLAAFSLFLWRRRRDGATAWLAGAWGCLGVVAVVHAGLPETTADQHGWHEWVTKLGVVLPITLYPYCLVRFAASFDRRRLLPRVAGVLTFIVVATAMVLPYWPADDARIWWMSAWQVAFFVQWVGLSLVAALRLRWLGRTEPAVTRRRMQLLSAAAITLSAVILLPLLAQPSSPVIKVLSAVLVLAGAGCVLVGLNPPAWLRLVWRRSEHGRIYEMQFALIRAETRAEVASTVLPVLTQLLACGAVAMLDKDGAVEASYGKPDDVADLTRALAESSAEAKPAGLLYAELDSGALVGQTGRYAPVFGSDEVLLFESSSMMVSTALSRIVSRDQLAVAHERALEASRLKSEFLANMSHEIRTPINGVIGITELLSATALNEEQRAYTTTIQSSADALLVVLNDILDFSKIEAGKLDLTAVDFRVQEAVEDVLALLDGAANGKQIELAMAVDKEVPAVVRGDVGRVRQVLLNLAGNAVKFTDHGEVVIRVCRVGQRADDRASSRPGAGDAGTRCRFEVSDTGPGIPAESVAELFESFSQADSSSTRRHGGTGLGLAISKRLVQLMGGTITVDTELGRGSTFAFELVLAPATQTSRGAPTVGRLRGRSVLVVDHNVTTRTILLETAEGWQLEAVGAASVEQALQELTRRHDDGGRFDLAWINHRLPDRTGNELAHLMAADDRFRATLRILLTSSGDRSGLGSDVLDAHLSKPVRPSVLRATVIRLLSRSRAEESRATSGTVPAAEQQAVAAAVRREAPGDGPRVLVAEDNPVSQQVARRMLESLGCVVDVVGTGAAALDAARTYTYELVFMDCQMPDLDGYQATAALRAHENGTRRTPVLALTASAMKGDAERCFEAGMDDYLTKPVRSGDFRAALTRWLPPTPDEAEPPVDLASLAAVSDDDDEQAAVLIELFVATTTDQLEQLSRAVSAADGTQVRQLSHAVRGAALSLGAQTLATHCEALETQGGQRPADWAKPLAAIEQEYGCVRTFLLSRIAGQTDRASVSRAPASVQERTGSSA